MSGVVPAWQQQLEETCAMGFAVVRPAPPQILWHYTSAVGLKGILDSRELWASHVLFVNDKVEASHARELIRRVLGRMVQRSPHAAMELALEQLDALLDRDVFMVAFSEEGDLLGQWRMYGDDGHGFAIGFDTGGLEQTGIRLHKMLYDEENEAEQLVQRMRMMTMVIDDAIRAAGPDGERAVELGAALAVEHCVAYSTVKHKAFEAEAEWRCSKVGGRPKARDRDGLLVPYLALPLWRDGDMPPLRAIRLGPLQDRARGRVAVEALWKSTCADALLPEIVASTVPYQRPGRR